MKLDIETLNTGFNKSIVYKYYIYIKETAAGDIFNSTFIEILEALQD